MEYACDFRYISKEVTINPKKQIIWVKRKGKEQREERGDNYLLLILSILFSINSRP